MRISTRSTAALAVAAATTAALTGAGTATAAARGHVSDVTVRMTSKAVRVVGSHDVHAGIIRFKVVTKDDRTHQLQILRLHKGYSLNQAGSDINKAFQGNVHAVRRVDRNIAFRGGTPASPGRPGYVDVKLGQGHYYLVDQNGNGLSWIDVHGKAAPGRIGHDGQITAFTYGFGHTRLPAQGWINVRNSSDQPHFVVFNRVKRSTTRKQVADYFNGGGHGAPPFARRAHTSVSVVSPNTHEVARINLPAGRYVIACFWPDDETGMPHAFMGMWRLVTLS